MPIWLQCNLHYFNLCARTHLSLWPRGSGCQQSGGCSCLCVLAYACVCVCVCPCSEVVVFTQSRSRAWPQAGYIWPWLAAVKCGWHGQKPDALSPLLCACTYLCIHYMHCVYLMHLFVYFLFVLRATHIQVVCVDLCYTGSFLSSNCQVWPAVVECLQQLVCVVCGRTVTGERGNEYLKARAVLGSSANPPPPRLSSIPLPSLRCWALDHFSFPSLLHSTQFCHPAKETNQRALSVSLHTFPLFHSASLPLSTHSLLCNLLPPSHPMMSYVRSNGCWEVTRGQMNCVLLAILRVVNCSFFAFEESASLV